MDRAVLAALAAWLIPDTEDLPGAIVADATGRWLDRALATRPELAAPLARAVAAGADPEPGTAIERLAGEDAEAYEALALALTAAWCMSPRVRRRIGFTAHAADPVLPGEADHDLDGGLLDAVIARGPRYVPTPAAGA